MGMPRHALEHAWVSGKAAEEAAGWVLEMIGAFIESLAIASRHTLSMGVGTIIVMLSSFREHLSLALA